MSQDKVLQKIIPYDNGEEAVMLRVDKTLEEMMEEKPSSRWDADYWHIKYDKLFETIRKHPTALLDEYRSEITSGYRAGGVEYSEKGSIYLQVRNVLDTGLDLVDVDLIAPESPALIPSKKVQPHDILLNRSGTGSVGRMTVFLNGSKNVYVGGHVYRFSVKDIPAIYVVVLLKTSFGKTQIHRFESGVSGKTELDLEEVLHVEIPLLSPSVQDHMESKYRKMSAYHNKAMEAKKEGDESGYRENLETAEKVLKELIAKTEAVIRGEREDVI